jgi:double-stranded uracil-DNA glycosylase
MTPPARLRLDDRLPDRPRILFVGINPGMTSASINHHFAGPSNRFWKLLYEARLTPVLMGPEDDDHLMTAARYGFTNLVARPTPGIDTLRREEYLAGVRVLGAKIRRVQPSLVALVGVTLGRVLFSRRPGEPVTPGLQTERFEGARVFVLPNPSGRNAHYSYAQMVTAFRALAAVSRRWP